jgi:hypothetical protein
MLSTSSWHDCVDYTDSNLALNLLLQWIASSVGREEAVNGQEELLGSRYRAVPYFWKLPWVEWFLNHRREDYHKVGGIHTYIYIGIGLCDNDEGIDAATKEPKLGEGTSRIGTPAGKRSGAGGRWGVPDAHGVIECFVKSLRRICY